MYGQPLPYPNEALAALQAAQSAWRDAEAAYEAGLELATGSLVARWQKLPSNQGKSPESLLALLHAVAETGTLTEDSGPLSFYGEEFLLEQQALAEVRDVARSAQDLALERHKAQARQRSVIARERELELLREVYPDYEPTEGAEGMEAEIARLSGLLEHTVLAQKVLERMDELSERMSDVCERVEELESAAQVNRVHLARPRWASKLRAADADLLLAAQAGDFYAAEAALAAGAAVNCNNEACASTLCERSGLTRAQFDETALHFVASLCDDRSDKAGGYLALAKLLVSKGGDLTLEDNVRRSHCQCNSSHASRRASKRRWWWRR